MLVPVTTFVLARNKYKIIATPHPTFLRHNQLFVAASAFNAFVYSSLKGSEAWDKCTRWTGKQNTINAYITKKIGCTFLSAS